VTGQGGGAYSPPEPITNEHDIAGFRCGRPSLDNWLRDHAMANEGRASRTFVVIARAGAPAGKVAAYYALATGGVDLSELPRKLRHNLPNPVPVVVLGRLAVDERHKGVGLGPGLLKEAILRTVDVSRSAGVRALIVHPIDEEAASFYLRYGFRPLSDGQSMFLAIEDMAAAV